ILEEAAKYIRDLIKPGTFSQKTLKRFKSFLGSKDMLEYYDYLVQRLDAAIQELQLDCALDTNQKVTCINNTVNEVDSNVKKLLKLAMVTKGADIREENIYVDPSKVEDDDEMETRGKTKRIKKMMYNGCVAVAVYKAQNIDKTRAVRQATILKELSACENIERFQGLMEKNELYVVTEWAANYDLEKYLHRSDIEILWDQKLKFAEGIAAALTFCHEADIFHHDVKSNFDMARFSNDATTSLTGQMKSIRWTAPEKLKNPCVPYSKEMDVYSFAIVMWEIATRKEPFYEINSDIEVSEKVKNDKLRPSPIPNDIIPEYENIMKKSWVESFRSRPTMYQISSEFHGFCKRYKAQRNNSLFSLQRYDSNASLSRTLSGKKFDFKAQINDDEPVKPHTRPAWKDITTALTSKNYKVAIEGLEQYAQSDAKEADLAKYYAGKLLYEGHHGVPKDEFQALIYLRDAAIRLPASSYSKFTPMAQYLYADVCLKGELYDRENGIRYLEMAVDASEKNALYLYGTILWNGEHGLQINNTKAKEMFKLSKSRGNEKAGDMLKLITQN
ncbi:10004_t:CDS:2, partial [Ambispora gerdemannii]